MGKNEDIIAQFEAFLKSKDNNLDSLIKYLTIEKVNDKYDIFDRNNKISQENWKLLQKWWGQLSPLLK
jgi:hypothetical protein